LQNPSFVAASLKKRVSFRLRKGKKKANWYAYPNSPSSNQSFQLEELNLDRIQKSQKHGYNK